MSRPRTAIGHVDSDCFYVSAERVRHRSLIGKPVGVLGNQGCAVIAKSYEMKAAGVKTGEPIWEAVRKCPNGLYVKRDFHWYELLSRRMLAAVEGFSPKVEFYSIDEFFFLAVPWQEGTLQQTAEAIRDRIWEACRLPVTVGIGRSRTLAKLFGDTAKPFGARALLDPQAEEALLGGLAVTEISGIAGRRAARLLPYGIRTCLDYRRADGRLIRQLLTKTGEVLHAELNGHAVQPVVVGRPAHQTLARGGSLGGASADPCVVYAWLVRNTERLIEELEFHDVRAGKLAVELAYAEGPAGVGQVSFDTATDRFDLLLDGGREALRRSWRGDGTPVTHMHVIASALRRSRLVQPGLFDPPAEPARSVAGLKRAVNERVRRFAVRSGATLPIQAVYDDATNDYDICDIRGKLCF
jgi:nucleotidyltransferase/DNA polymerase involved in DNA repair